MVVRKDQLAEYEIEDRSVYASNNAALLQARARALGPANPLSCRFVAAEVNQAASSSRVKSSHVAPMKPPLLPRNPTNHFMRR